MYPKRFDNSRSHGRRFGGGFKSRGRGRRAVKRLDPRLFVKKAVEVKEDVFVPKNSFSDFKLHPNLKDNVLGRGYTAPTPIQDQTIPALLAGKDVVGIAATGTGKTAAFLLPLINKVLNDKKQKVLIVVPTRELAVQIQDEFRIFTRNMRLYSVVCIGGVHIRPQINGLSRFPEFVIGTPGRLRDLERNGKLSFYNYNNIVLDEVDRMMDMGFINEVKYIVSKLPKERQSLFFSATMTPSVENSMRGFLHNPVTVTVKSTGTVNIDQDVVSVTGGKTKLDVLHELLRKDGFDKVLIFGNTKWGVSKLADSLNKFGIRAAVIHGNKNQSQRQKAIDMFKTKSIQCLLATDVASRGLDINDVTHVINYDQPENYDDYIHRIGRTGRAGKKGIALTFLD